MHVVHLGGRTKEKENKICGFEVSAIWKQKFKLKSLEDQSWIREGKK